MVGLALLLLASAAAVEFAPDADITAIESKWDVDVQAEEGIAHGGAALAGATAHDKKNLRAAASGDSSSSQLAVAGAAKMATFEKQAASFRNGSAVVVNVHITHHAGTTMCNSLASQVFRTLPEFGAWWEEQNRHRPNNCNGVQYLDHVMRQTLRDASEWETLLSAYLPQTNYLSLELEGTQTRPQYMGDWSK